MVVNPLLFICTYYLVITIYTLYVVIFRFEIEDVAEPDCHDHQENVSGQVDLTVHSFGYNTVEAVPMTVYYRDSGGAEGKTRPTLDNLRRREKQQVEPVQVHLVCTICLIIT